MIAVGRAVQLFDASALNCAQSVLKAFQERLAIGERLILEARAQGGGRAPEGRCGALHAALTAATGEEMRERILKRFAGLAGSGRCRDIRRAGRLSCSQCVEAAARCLDEELSRAEADGRGAGSGGKPCSCA